MGACLGEASCRLLIGSAKNVLLEPGTSFVVAVVVVVVVVVIVSNDGNNTCSCNTANLLQIVLLSLGAATSYRKTSRL